MKHGLFKRILSLVLFSVILIPGIYAADINNDGGVENTESSANSTESTGFTEDKLPPCISKEDVNEAGYTKRLYEEEPDLNTLVFENADGSRSMHVYGVPVKYVDSEGNVKDKTLTLEKTADGWQDSDGGEFSFGETLSDGYKLNCDGYTIGISVVSGKSAYADVSKDARGIEYVYSESVKYEYLLTCTGVKENIVLSEYVKDNVFTFELDTDGLIPGYNKAEGEYALFDESGKAVITLGTVYIYDASGENAAVGSMKFEKTDGGKYLMYVCAPEEFLSSPDTKYPVTIDPSITVTGAYGTNDAIVYSGMPGSAFGSYYYENVGCYNSSYGYGRLLVKFPGLSGNTVFSTLEASNITSAYYKVYLSSSSTSASVKPYAYKATWTENTIKYSDINWSNKVDLGMSAVSVSGVGFKYFYITSLVKQWLSGTTYTYNTGMILQNTNETSSTYCKCFLGTEYANNQSTPTDYMPSLVINYSPTPSQVLADGVYYIKNNYYATYVTAEAEAAISYKGMINVYLAALNSGNTQKWYVRHLQNNYYIITPLSSLTKSLTSYSFSDNSDVDAYLCNPTEDYNFYMDYGGDVVWQISYTNASYKIKQIDNTTTYNLGANQYSELYLSLNGGLTNENWSFLSASVDSSLVSYYAERDFCSVGQSLKFMSYAYISGSICAPDSWLRETAYTGSGAYNSDGSYSVSFIANTYSSAYNYSARIEASYNGIPLVAGDEVFIYVADSFNRTVNVIKGTGIYYIYTSNSYLSLDECETLLPKCSFYFQLTSGGYYYLRSQSYNSTSTIDDYCITYLSGAANNMQLVQKGSNVSGNAQQWRLIKNTTAGNNKYCFQNKSDSSIYLNYNSSKDIVASTTPYYFSIVEHPQDTSNYIIANSYASNFTQGNKLNFVVTIEDDATNSNYSETTIKAGIEQWEATGYVKIYYYGESGIPSNAFPVTIKGDNNSGVLGRYALTLGYNSLGSNSDNDNWIMAEIILYNSTNNQKMYSQEDIIIKKVLACEFGNVLKLKDVDNGAVNPNGYLTVMYESPTYVKATNEISGFGIALFFRKWTMFSPN